MFSLILKWCNAGRHVPNLDVGETEDDDCPIRFKGLNCIAHFLEWLDTLTDKDTPSITVIAPSFQGYDGYFVVDDIRQNHIVEQVRNWGGGGNWCKWTLAEYALLTLLTFGLTELKKGYFPHLFNTPENQDYEGPIPDHHYYMPEVMSVSGRNACETWHAKQTETFNFA